RATQRRLLDTARHLAAFDEDVAQEATQQAFIVLLTKWSERRNEDMEANRKYVAKIISRRIIDQYRFRGRWTEFDDEESLGQSHPPAPGPLGPEYKALLRRIDEMPARRRAVLGGLVRKIVSQVSPYDRGRAVQVRGREEPLQETLNSAT